VNSTPHYLQPYKDAVKTFGGTFDATLWQSKKGQLIRFEVFRMFVDFTNCSIVDVGCGIGDFAQFLVDQKVAYDSFYGIDAMEEMIVTAANRSIERSTFSTVDIVTSLDQIPKTDWITCSGTLNAMGEALAIQTIDALFERCNVGFAFNFLSDQSGRDPERECLEPATRFNTIGLLNHVFTQTPLISFTQTYLNGHDATIVMRKL
jgi:SAM-dependent methyltransferase